MRRRIIEGGLDTCCCDENEALYEALLFGGAIVTYMGLKALKVSRRR